MADEPTQQDLDKATAKAADYGTKPKPKTYIAPYAVYVDHIHYKPGEPFTTAAIPGDEWEIADPVEAAALIAAAKDKNPDVNYEALSTAQLRAVAAANGIVIPAGVTKKADLLAVIRAQNEPTL